MVSRITYPLLLLSLSINTCISQDRAESIDRFLNAYHDQDLFNGVALVGQGDRIVYQGAFGYANMEWGIDNTTEGRFRIGSMTKQFTATLIMILEQEGKLDLEKMDPLTAYLRSDSLLGIQKAYDVSFFE